MNAVPGAGHLPFPAPCPPQAPHPQHRLGNVSAAGHRGHKRDQTGTVAGPLCERCGTEEGAGAENSGGTRLFQRQKRRVKGPRVCLGRRVPLTVPEAAPGAGRAAGCRADGQGRGRGLLLLLQVPSGRVKLSLLTSTPHLAGALLPAAQGVAACSEKSSPRSGPARPAAGSPWDSPALAQTERNAARLKAVPQHHGEPCRDATLPGEPLAGPGGHRVALPGHGVPLCLLGPIRNLGRGEMECPRRRHAEFGCQVPQPRKEAVTAPSLPEFNKRWDNGLRHMM